MRPNLDHRIGQSMQTQFRFEWPMSQRGEVYQHLVLKNKESRKCFFFLVLNMNGKLAKGNNSNIDKNISIDF